ncbi:MAG: FtsX-like permease family protein [Pedosphaera sp.]|nr:FtsX-like permease family protein [Pedosphaera sp.]MSU43553.1 FtsX-like permease family protein [Pedosphaera sp.]
MNYASFIRGARAGIKSLLLHKTRSLLTMLGIIFGVCSVIAMLAIGEGASFEAQERIRQKGALNIILRSKKPSGDASAGGAQRSYIADYGLKYADMERIRHSVPGIKRMLPQRLEAKRIRFPKHAECEVVGTLPLYREMIPNDMVAGRFLTDWDEREQKNICVLSEDLARSLFSHESPLEQEIRVANRAFTVVGVIRELSRVYQAGAGTGGPVSEGRVFVPLHTFRSHMGEQNIRRSAGSYQVERVQLSFLTVEFNNENDVARAAPLIRHALADLHKKQDFVVEVPLDELRALEATKRLFSFVLGSIAAISLLVGGIGIMNIMLATVTERTREIGVRRALGAKKRQIIAQFLMETGVLSVVGGLIGVVVGVFFPYLLSWGIHAMTGNEYRVVVTVWSVLMALGISVATGIAFGVYPARRAAELDPIEALRHG